MPNIELDENGNRIDRLEEKNNEVKRALEPILKEFIEERNMLLAAKKQPKLGYRFMKQIMLELAKYPPMKARDFVDLDYETVNYYYLKFTELTAFYNRYFEIVDNKNIFMRYCGLDVRQYEELENHTDERIQSVMRMINGDYIGMGWVASESGEADVKGTTTRLRSSGGAGHNVTTATEDKLVEKISASSPTELLNQVSSIIGGDIKALQ